MRALLALVFIPAIATAARVTVIPPGPIHVGGWVIVEIELGVGTESGYPPNVPVTNFTSLIVRSPEQQPVANGEWKRSEKGPTTTLVFRGHAISEGEIVFGPFSYTRKDGRPFRAPAVRLHAGPDLANGWHPAESLRALKKAGMTETVIVATLRKPRNYVGEEVVVEFWAFGDLDQAYFEPQARRLIDVPAFERASFDDEDAIRADTLDGQVVQKRLMTTLHLFATLTGSYPIPAFRFEGQDRRKERLVFSQGVYWNARFTIEAPSIVIEILPRPAEAQGPMGTFEMQCSQADNVRYWPILGVIVTGSGELEAAEPPVLTRVPQETVITIPTPEEMRQRVLWREFLFEVHADKARIPPITFEYYDTTKEANVVLRCDPPEVARRFDEKTDRPAPPPPPPVEMDALTRINLDIAGLFIVAASVVAFIQTIRG